MEKNAVKCSGFEELHWNNAVEFIVMKIKTTEVAKRAELRWNIAAERFSGEGNSDNSWLWNTGDVTAGNSRPTARVRIATVPIGEEAVLGLVDGEFKRQKCETIGGERKCEIEKKVESKEEISITELTSLKNFSLILFFKLKNCLIEWWLIRHRFGGLNEAIEEKNEYSIALCNCSVVC